MAFKKEVTMIYLNGQKLEVTTFPDNTSQVWKVPHLDELRFAYVRWVFSHEAEFLHLAQLKALLDTRNLESYLHIAYLPYGRQDKTVANDTTFALRPFATLLNSLKFKQITINDPHSDVALQLIKKSTADYPIRVIQRILYDLNIDKICYPDNGAYNKYTVAYNDFVVPMISGSKVRNQSTGVIEKYALYGDPEGCNVLVIDDICDGGMTFKLLAKDLLAAGAKSVVLFVTHGIFSKGLKTLTESGIKRIFTKDGEASEIQGQIVYRTIA